MVPDLRAVVLDRAARPVVGLQLRGRNLHLPGDEFHGLTGQLCPVPGRWTRPKLRTPEAGERWTWLIIAAHTQIRLLRGAAADLRRPWEKPAEPGWLTPARVRRGFRNLCPHLTCPARAPKPSTPGPGRPLGSKNQRPATRYDVGKTVKRPESITERNRLRP